MKRITALVLGVGTVLALAACATGGGSFPQPVITQVTPGVFTAGASGVTIEGAGLFQMADGDRILVEFCGVTVTAELDLTERRTIVLAPAGVLAVDVGTRLLLDVPANVQAGVSDLRLVRPDGRTTVLTNGVTCAAGGEPQQNRAPTARIALESHERLESERLLTYVSASTDPDGDALTYLWEVVEGGDETSTATTLELVRPASSKHTVRLTVTDPFGASDSTVYTTRLDPAETEAYVWIQQAEQLPPDVVRLSWYEDVDAQQMVIETELTTAFRFDTYEQYDECPLEPVRLAGSAAPQQVDELPLLGGVVLLDTDADPATGRLMLDGAFGADAVFYFDELNANGKSDIYDVEHPWSCDPAFILGEAERGVDGLVAKLTFPTALFGSNIDVTLYGFTNMSFSDEVPDGIIEKSPS